MKTWLKPQKVSQVGIDWETPIDFDFSETIKREFPSRYLAKMFEEELLRKWHVVVPDLSHWPPVNNREGGVYAWRVKLPINEDK